MSEHVINLENWQQACNRLGPDVAAVALMLRNAAREGDYSDCNCVFIDLSAMRGLEVRGPSRGEKQFRLLLDAFLTICVIAITRMKMRGYLQVERVSDGLLRCNFIMPENVQIDKDEAMLVTDYVC